VLLSSACFIFPTKAHNVLWFELIYPPFTGPLEIPVEVSDVLGSVPPSGIFGIVPTFGEPCTVIVHLDPIDSPYIKAEIIPPNPALEVDVKITVLQFPPTA